MFRFEVDDQGLFLVEEKSDGSVLYTGPFDTKEFVAKSEQCRLHHGKTGKLGTYQIKQVRLAVCADHE